MLTEEDEGSQFDNMIESVQGDIEQTEDGMGIIEEAKNVEPEP